MALTEHEKIFIQNQDAPDFPSYLRSLWNFWPALRYSQARRKASKLWKARKAWLNTLEPSLRSLEKKRCKTCHSSFHEMWQPSLNNPILTNDDDSPKTVLTLVQWEKILGPLEVSCWGCKENQPNQLAHMDYGGCLYNDASDQAILPLLPASPPSRD